MGYEQIDLQFPCKECGQLKLFMGFRSVRKPGTQVVKFVCKSCAAEVFQMYIKELAKLKDRLDKQDAEKVEQVVEPSYTDENGSTWL